MGLSVDYTAKQRISEVEDRSIKTSQTTMQRGKKKKRKNNNKPIIEHPRNVGQFQKMWYMSKENTRS